MVTTRVVQVTDHGRAGAVLRECDVRTLPRGGGRSGFRLGQVLMLCSALAMLAATTLGLRCGPG